MKRRKVTGWRMLQATSFVAANPGCTKFAVAQEVGPHGSNRYGYNTVERAMRAGLIEARDGARAGTYALFVTEAGRAALAEVAS